MWQTLVFSAVCSMNLLMIWCIFYVTVFIYNGYESLCWYMGQVTKVNRVTRQPHLLGLTHMFMCGKLSVYWKFEHLYKLCTLVYTAETMILTKIGNSLCCTFMHFIFCLDFLKFLGWFNLHLQSEVKYWSLHSRIHPIFVSSQLNA